ncbi:hypothetical protein O6H91_16G011500 [Diphasiastrum complanatum]|uniref:Uncharacterized protein n=1 Tax=Diphasiastrum complanatum TaxID=34168 RepID=A0ACC2B9W5_DIPCM|nr:hypothetical protein O6H91_16G011500 [Diphasiastrum complanatum]
MGATMMRLLSLSFLAPPPALPSCASSHTIHVSRHCGVASGRHNAIAMPLSDEELAMEVPRVCSSLVDESVVDSRRGVLRMAAVLGFGGALGTISDNAVALEGSCENFTVAPSGLSFCDSLLGAGVPASKGMLIKAHYTGTLENGQVFDSSYKRGKPLVFRIGVGEVIKGWDDGILGTVGIPPMLAGGKRKLRIPPELAYGERGAGCSRGSCLIPPNSVLLFDVEFVGKS